MDGYLSWIPTRLIEANISAGAIRLFLLVSSLVESKGYCFASNRWLVERLKCSERSVQNWLAELQEQEALWVGIENQNERRIYLFWEKPRGGEEVCTPAKSFGGTPAKVCGPIDNKQEIDKTNGARAKPARSIAIVLEDLTEIPNDLRWNAGSLPAIDGEWAKFRNHHISVRSKHTRIDLAWNTWCRNAAKWQSRSNANAAGGAGKGGGKRHDHVAAATDTVLAELFGVRRAKGDRGTDDHAADARVVGGGEGPTDASSVDALPGDKALLIEA